MTRILLFFLFFTLFLNNIILVYAQEKISSSSGSQTIEYLLPYPGILPDSRFYFLKTGRDKIVGFLISDPVKKIEFNLLQADKRLSAGVSLSNKKGKEKLIISTLSKGENYFEEGIARLKEAKKQGMDIRAILAKMETSSKKHLEVLKKMEEKMGPNYKQEIIILEKRMANFKKEVIALSPN